MNSEEYEVLIKDIVAGIFKERPELEQKDVRQGTKNKWEGISGQKHQIDVSLGGEKELILVECKYWNRPVNVGVVNEFQSKVDDIKRKDVREIQALIVSTKGFQSGALKVAGYNKIQLSTVTSVEHAVNIILKVFLKGSVHATSNVSGSLTVNHKI